ncbi:MAG: hypothetical protein K1X79_04415 [Oligoflexia bacterium]|nr:hypothetical protein [Oligoflexia bacterium]
MEIIPRKKWLTYQSMWWAAAAVVGFLDFLTGPDIQFPILFMLPVAGMARYCSLAPAILLSIVLTLFRAGTLYAWGVNPFGLIPSVNSLIRIVMLLFVAYAVRQFVELKILRGFLPICASCKKIRSKEGGWEQIESYISTRSEALFSHGICPECTEILYGDQIRKMAQSEK